MNDKITQRIIDTLVESIDIPDSACEKAKNRYKDLGEWFGRREANCFPFHPHIYPQGSFRLGTIVRSDEYDLDFGCRLRQGVSISTHTQKQLKMLVGTDMEEYRKARGIQSKLEEKPRCWRLQYADELSFHMDGVPSIPQEAQQRQMLREAMVKAGSADVLAQNVTRFAGAITDNTLPNYQVIDPEWRISNSEGYALWFESRMKLAMALLEKRALLVEAARIDDLPISKWKSPLQQCVQVLKHHRNVMFSDDPDGKPVSVIITTLAAEAYQGEEDVATALQRVLMDMGDYVRKIRPRVPNPVNPSEDFADKWPDPKYRNFNLEKNFWLWLEQARADYKSIAESRDAEFLAEQIQAKFASRVDVNALKGQLGLGTVQVMTSPKSHRIVETPAKPWTMR